MSASRRFNLTANARIAEPRTASEHGLYIDLIQSEATFPLIRELYDKEAPGIYFSSIAAQELLTGACS